MSNSKETRSTYFGTAAAFLGLAVTMWITMDNWAVALPFVALAVTFVVLGAKPEQNPKPESHDAQ
jgi:hypothetical protein